jgi:hypothetical protein
MIPVPGVRYRHRVGRSGSLSALTLPFVFGVLNANGMALAYVNSAIWQSLDEYYRQFERILWRYSVWEGRLVALAGGDSDKIADLRRTMRSAYESCRHPTMKERLAKNSWWPGFIQAIEEAKADVRGLAQDPGTDGLSRKISVVHPKWRGRLTLRPEGRLVHDQTGDLGTYTEDGDGSSLVVRWDTFATEVFVNIDGTYVLQK